MEAGLRVSKKNAQICKRQVKYLGFNIIWGQQMLGTERKQEVCANAAPTTREKVHELLEAAGFWRIWIPGCWTWPDPYMRPWKEKRMLPLNGSQEVAFQTIKAKVSDVSASELTNTTRAFNLCGHEKYKVTLGVLTQKFRPWQRPVVYLSK